MWELCPTGYTTQLSLRLSSGDRWPAQAIDCIFYHPLASFTRHLTTSMLDGVKYHTQTSSFISLRLSSSDSPALLKCELLTLSANCAGKLRNSPITWLHSANHSAVRAAVCILPVRIIFADRSSQITHHQSYAATDKPLKAVGFVRLAAVSTELVARTSVELKTSAYSQ